MLFVCAKVYETCWAQDFETYAEGRRARCVGGVVHSDSEVYWRLLGCLSEASMNFSKASKKLLGGIYEISRRLLGYFSEAPTKCLGGSFKVYKRLLRSF